jgi:hypothetical protein
LTGDGDDAATVDIDARQAWSEVTEDLVRDRAAQTRQIVWRDPLGTLPALSVIPSTSVASAQTESIETRPMSGTGRPRTSADAPGQ